MEAQRFIATVLYLCVDITYVVLSLPAYGAVVERIQGAPMPGASKPGALPVALATYALLGLGWNRLVAPLAETGPDGLLPALKRAAMVGSLVYGVFNGTLYCMLVEWTADIAARDTAWGIVSTVSVTACYHLWASSRRGQHN